MSIQLNFIEIQMELKFDTQTPRWKDQYIKGLIKLLEYMKTKTFIESNYIRIKTGLFIVKRWNKNFYIPTHNVHSISIFKDRNILEFYIDIEPYGTIKLTIFMDSENTIHHITLESLEGFFSVNYVDLKFEIQIKSVNKKRLSWWNI